MTPGELADLEQRLTDQRPLPSPGFRGRLGRRLAARRVPPPRPERLTTLIAGYATGGTVLLLVAAISS